MYSAITMLIEPNNIKSVSVPKINNRLGKVDKGQKRTMNVVLKGIKNNKRILPVPDLKNFI
mgnify:CR=1 FL=1